MLWVRNERKQDLDSGLGYNVYRPDPTDFLLPEKPHFLPAPQPSQIIPPPGRTSIQIRSLCGKFQIQIKAVPAPALKEFCDR